MDENKWKGHVAVEVPMVSSCDGCVYDETRKCPPENGGPSCNPKRRDDERNIIWIPDGGYSSLSWYRVGEKPPPEETEVLVLVRNKNKEDGIPLFDIATHDGEAWRPRHNTWEDIIMWALPTAPEGFK